MPVAKSLHKVAKKVAGSEKSVHPRGRKFKQLNKATLRQAKLAKHKALRTNVKEAECKLGNIYRSCLIIILTFFFFFLLLYSCEIQVFQRGSQTCWCRVI